MNYENIIYTSEAGVATIVLNRPRVLNALSKALKVELLHAIRDAANDAEVRAVVVTGAGESFSAGQDLNEAKTLTGTEAEEWAREYARLYDAIRSLEVPLIAAVDGWAVGAGCQLALLADIRLSTATARFGMPEIQDGIPAIFGLALLANVLGMSRAIRMVITGEPMAAREALAAGMVSKIHPRARLLREAKALAAKLAAFPPGAMRSDKQFARELGERNFRAAAEFAVSAHHQAFGSGDAKKAMEAFLKK